MENLQVIKSNLIEYLEILKAKKRNEGEVWTQPSGRKVTKKNGKIVPANTNNVKAKKMIKEIDLENAHVEKKYIEDHLRYSLRMKNFSEDVVSKMDRKQLEVEARKHYGKQVDKLIKNAKKNIYKHPEYKKLIKKESKPSKKINQKKQTLKVLMDNVSQYFDKIKKILQNIHEAMNEASPYSLGIKTENSIPEIIPFNPKEGAKYKFQNGKLIIEE